MTYPSQFVAHAEGLDVYPAGVIGNAYPWFQTAPQYQGTLGATAGSFNTNGLVFGTQVNNASGMELQFPSTVQLQRSTSAPGGSWIIGVSAWFNVGTPSAIGSDTLLALGTSASGREAYPILGISNSAGNGLSLEFPTVFTVLAQNPRQFSIGPNVWSWVGVYLAYTPGGGLTATYCLNGGVLFQDIPVAWNVDLFAPGQIANRLKFYSAVTAGWTVDDVIIQAVSGADLIWPGVATPESIPFFSPRQISLAQAVANGPVDEFIPTNGEPNYLAATDRTGVNTVTSISNTGLDLYQFNTNLADIKALVYRGNSTDYKNLSAVQNVNGVTGAMPLNTGGGTEFIGISENDGANQWVVSSFDSASFGQLTHL